MVNAGLFYELSFIVDLAGFLNTTDFCAIFPLFITTRFGGK